MNTKPVLRFVGGVFHRLLVASGAIVMTLAFFLVLPLMQAINKPPANDTTLVQLDSAVLQPPPPPPEQEPEQEPEPEEPPPEMLEQTQPLDLSQLELALNPGFAEGWMGGDFAVKLDTRLPGGESVDALFSLADLDQKPRAVYQPSPVIDAQVRKAGGGTIYVLFVVNQDGRVENPIVQDSRDPVLERPALAAVKQWRFEPGKRQGEPVRFRMRVPITFPEGS